MDRMQNKRIRRGRPLKSPPASSRLGAHLRAARLRGGLTLEGLGKKAGITHGRLSEIESGNVLPGRRSLAKISAALNLNLDRLWQLRASSLVAREWNRLIHHARLVRRNSIAAIERIL